MKSVIKIPVLVLISFIYNANGFSQTPILYFDFEEATGNYVSKGKSNASLMPLATVGIRGESGSGLAGSRAWNSLQLEAKQGLGKARLVLDQPVEAIEAPKSLTIAFWFKTESDLIGNTRFLHKTNDNKHGYSIQSQNSNTIQLSLCDGNKANVLAARSPLYGLKRSWVFFAVTLNDQFGEVRFYAGSERSALKLVSTQKFRGKIAASPAKLTIGNISSSADRGFVGLIDDFVFYDSALTQKQLEKVMSTNQRK